MKDPKFILAAFASVCALVMVFVHSLTGEEWMITQSLILSLYGAHDVLAGKLCP